MSMVAAFEFNRRFLEERVEVVMGKKKKWISWYLLTRLNADMYRWQQNFQINFLQKII